MFMTLCWTCTSMFTALEPGAQALTQHTRCFSPVLSREGSSPLTCWQKLFLTQPEKLFTFFAARAYCWYVFNLLFSREIKMFFCKAAFHLVSPQHNLVHGIVSLQLQGSAFPLVELHEFPVGPFLQPVEVPLDGSASIWYVKYSFQLCIACKLAEGAHSMPIIQALNEEIKQYWPQYQLP